MYSQCETLLALETPTPGLTESLIKNESSPLPHLLRSSTPLFTLVQSSSLLSCLVSNNSVRPPPSAIISRFHLPIFESGWNPFFPACSASSRETNGGVSFDEYATPSENRRGSEEECDSKCRVEVLNAHEIRGKADEPCRPANRRGVNRPSDLSDMVIQTNTGERLNVRKLLCSRRSNKVTS